MSKINKRRGKLRINREFLMSCNGNMLKALFSEFYVMAVDINHYTSSFYDVVVYYGLSPQFDIIEDGIEIPEYNVIMTSNQDGGFSVKLEKKQ